MVSGAPTWSEIVAASEGRYWIYCRTLGAPRVLSHFPGQSAEAASTIKLPILMALLDAAGRKQVSLRSRVDLRRSQVGRNGSGLLQSMYFNTPFTLYNLAFLMMSVSDNVATNAIVDLLGFDYVNDYIRKLGAKNTRLIMSKIDFPNRYPKDQPPRMATTTPREMADLVELLVTGQALSNAHTKIAMKFMQRVQNSTFSRRLPHRTISKFGSKTGWISLEHQRVGVLNEAGYIISRSGNTHIFSVLSSHPVDPDLPYSPDATNRREFSYVAEALLRALERV